MNIGQDDELLDLAARSGCRSVLIGIEAEDPGVLSEINKRMNVKIGVANYEEVFRRLNIHGIRILGAFIFGMDGDDEQAMLRRADYIARSRVNAVQVSCLTPLPGTRLMKRITDGGKLLYANFPDDWFRYDFTEIVFRPKGMTPERFGELFHACIRRIYGPRTVLLKALRTLVSTGSFEAALYASFMNYAYGKAFRIMHKRSAG
jgi:radical SAM superfamily enzyme YgiQ (UPF0313 family)